MDHVTRRTSLQGAIAGPAARQRTASAAPVGPAADPLGTFSHVVVLMLENRSFDSLLGNLYDPAGLPPGKSFEGLIGTDLSNPIPAGAPAPPGVKTIPVLSATKTMSMKWGVPTLTARDAAAPDFQQVFTSSRARPASSWPVLADHIVPLAWFRQDFSDAPLNELQRSIVGMVATLPQAEAVGLDASAVQTVGDAVALIQRVPGLPGAQPTTPPRFWRPRDGARAFIGPTVASWVRLAALPDPARPRRLTYPLRRWPRDGYGFTSQLISFRLPSASAPAVTTKCRPLSLVPAILSFVAGPASAPPSRVIASPPAESS